MQWGHRLIIKPDWQQRVTKHFDSIFKQQPGQQVNEEMGKMRQLLGQRCKETPYKLVEEEELRAVQERWQRKKATGPDRVSSEVLSFFLSHSSAASKLVWTLDDAPYKGRSPARDLPDITRKDTRPITLSNTIDRTVAQLLLHRCNHTLQQQPSIYQFARAGKQASELLTTIRQMARLISMAKTWFWRMSVMNRC